VALPGLTGGSGVRNARYGKAFNAACQLYFGHDSA
jgi:hypothetical protein